MRGCRHDPEPLRCVYCGQRFPNWSSLGPHEREHWRIWAAGIDAASVQPIEKETVDADK